MMLIFARQLQIAGNVAVHLVHLKSVEVGILLR